MHLHGASTKTHVQIWWSKLQVKIVRWEWHHYHWAVRTFKCALVEHGYLWTSIPQAASGSRDDASVLPRVESDTDLRKGAPPSYDDALRFSNAFLGTGTDVPPTEPPEIPAVPVPPYPVAGGDPSHPPTADSSNLPYPNTSGGATPYPPVGMVGVPYPHADVSSTPYPPTEAPYPQGYHAYMYM